MTATARLSPRYGPASLPLLVMTGVLLLAGSALLGYGLGRLALVGTLPQDAVHWSPAATEQIPVIATADVFADASMPVMSAPIGFETPKQAWPALFGEIPDPMPQVKAVDAPPPQPEAAPTLSESFVLTGLVAGEGNAWALMRGRNGDVLVRVGDQLPGGETVVRINSDGVMLETPLGLMLVVFDDPDSPLPTADPATGAYRP